MACSWTRICRDFAVQSLFGGSPPCDPCGALKTVGRGGHARRVGPLRGHHQGPDYRYSRWTRRPTESWVAGTRVRRITATGGGWRRRAPCLKSCRERGGELRAAARTTTRLLTGSCSKRAVGIGSRSSRSCPRSLASTPRISNRARGKPLRAADPKGPHGCSIAIRRDSIGLTVLRRATLLLIHRPPRHERGHPVFDHVAQTD